MGDKLVTPEFRVSFPSVFAARAFSEGQTKKYDLTALFSAGTDLTAMKALAKQAAVDKWGDKIPPGLRSPFRDGSDKPDLDGYEGCIFVKMTSLQRPGVVDQNVQPIIEEGDFYGGCWARAVVTAFAYDQMGNKGVSFGLQNVQKMRDDDAFSGRGKPEDDFDPVATDVTGEGTTAKASDEDIFGVNGENIKVES